MTKTRRKLRARAKRECAVMWNDAAPPGWVEIQRDDERSSLNDAQAAALVCRAAGMPRSCVAFVSWACGDPIFYDAVPPHASVACVPAAVAYAAGILSASELATANVDGT